MMYENNPAIQTSYTPAVNSLMPDYKNPAGLTGVVKVLLLTVIVLLFANFYFGWCDFQYLQSVLKSDDYQFSRFDELQMPVSNLRILTSLVYIAVNLAAWITLLVWVYRTCKNTHALGGANLSYSPGWAVGWFLIPVVNLVMPCLVVQSIYKASRNPVNWKQVPFNALILGWWICSVVGGLLGGPSLPHGNSAMAGAMLAFQKIHLGAMVILTVSQGLLFLIVTEITEYQNALCAYFSENPDKHPSAAIACQVQDTECSPLAAPKPETEAVPLCQNT